jgi:hypothetical protein
MTTGNVFQLMINDGKQDHFLMAYDSLKEDIANYGSKYGEDNVSKILEKIKQTHSIFINNEYKPFAPMAYSYYKANDKSGLQKFGSQTEFKIPLGGTWIHDMVLHIRLSGLSTKSPLDKIKFADLLGHRLLENVQLVFNKGTIIDEYGSEEMNVYYQMELDSNDRPGWLRGVGQEQIRTAYLSANPALQEYREYRFIGDGPQTLKNKHDDIDLWIPLIFWFNKNIENALPIYQMQYGQLSINVKFRKIEDLIAVSDFGGGGKYNTPDISVCDLYTNQIETIPEIKKLIFGKNKYNLQVIKTKKIYIRELDAPDGTVLLNGIKYPTESIVFGFRPVTNNQYIEVWYKNSIIEVKSAEQAISIGGSLSTNQAIYFHEQSVIGDVGLKINDNDIYPVTNNQLYGSYIPYASKGLNTPIDAGWLLFNFAFDNKDCNPAGYINLSRNREVYITYTNGNISSVNKCNLIVIANIINFLVFKDNNAQLKFI